MRFAVLCVLSLVLASPVFAAPGTCTLTWDAPTAYTDGSPLSPPPTQYHLYLSNQSGVYPDPPLATVDTPPVTVPCQGKRYWVVTAVVDGLESDYSNELLTKQSKNPTNLRVQ